MSRNGHSPEETVTRLWQVDALGSLGRSLGDAVRAAEATCHSYRKELDGLKRDQVRRLEELELEKTDPRSPLHRALKGRRLAPRLDAETTGLRRVLGRVARVPGFGGPIHFR